MDFISTRSQSPVVGFEAALLQGLAPDGGLYVPTVWPAAGSATQPGMREEEGALPSIANDLLAPFVASSSLASSLPDITAEAFNFFAPLVPLSDRLSVLELFHGPTAAFKDFGARFLAACFTRLRQSASRPLKILVATSGDTGGAVAAAFHHRAGIEVDVLFPKGLVSPTQQRQLTCWDDNVRAFAVRGSFDDCQRLVKAAFVDPASRQRAELSSANSINLGRLLPQTVYYAAASLAIWRKHGEPASFIIPSGNLGNAVACIWARKLGLPIDRIILAHNANRTVPDYLACGDWQPRASIATLASAMDVGNPSNMERLQTLFPDISSLRHAISACSIDDAAIRARIRTDFLHYGQIWCPHTATAAEAYAGMPAPVHESGRWILVATAHPAKFREIVEPLIGREVSVPPALAALFSRPTMCTEIEADLAALQSHWN